MAFKKIIISLFASALLVATGPGYDNTLYLIRHGEKPANGSNGLSLKGLERAQCLRNVFGASSSYEIGYIMAEQYKSDGSHNRPYLTVLPLATDLGLTVDTSCHRSDEKCVKDAVAAYAATKNSKSVLICWRHGKLADIAAELGVKNAPDYPSDSYNIIWTIQDQKLVSTTSEDCPGLDPG